MGGYSGSRVHLAWRRRGGRRRQILHRVLLALISCIPAAHEARARAGSEVTGPDDSARQAPDTKTPAHSDAEERGESRAPARSGTESLPRPTDPNSAAQLRSPLGGWGPRRGASPPPTRFRRHNTRRAFQLTVSPQYAAIKVPLVARERRTRHGGGATIEAEIRALRWLFVRLFASYSAHPVDEQFSEVGADAKIANAGTYQATTFGASMVYPIDLGRVVSTVDVGGGGMVMSTPNGRLDGQRSQPCLSGGVCDFGLACSPQSTCEMSVVPQFNLSLSLDVLFGVRWSLGAQIRYYGLLSSISDGANGLPQLLTIGIRLGARW